MRANQRLRSARRLVFPAPCSALVLLVAAACGEAPVATPSEPRQVSSRASIGGFDARAGAGPEDGRLGVLDVTLPFSGTTSGTGDAFRVTQAGSGGAVTGRNTGIGRAGFFEIANPGNGSNALTAQTGGSGRAGFFEILSPSNVNPALQAQTSGSGRAVFGHSSGAGLPSVAVFGLVTGGGRAGVFQLSNPTSGNTALEALTSGQGIAGAFRIQNVLSASAAVYAETRGSGAALLADHTGASGPIALFRSDGTTQARINKNGRGFFNGGTQTGGADVAEAFEVEGEVGDYRPGDVLVISRRSDRRVERSGEAYSTRVVGVHATRPGVLLTERGIDERLDDTVPLGVVGVIPTRVTAENGPIRRGDLLVTAHTRGHAMRADPLELNGIEFYPSGAILGKALEEFEGRGSGMIRVLVNVK